MPKGISPTTWILTADGRKACVWEWQGNDEPLRGVADLTLETAETRGFSRDLRSDRPGRSFASADTRRAMMEPHHDPHEYAKLQFAHDVAAKVNMAHRGNRFKRLVVIAPPRILGALREDFSNGVKATVIGELDKDLMKADTGKILQHAQPFLS